VRCTRWIEEGGGSAELQIPDVGGSSHRGRWQQRGPGTAAADPWRGWTEDGGGGGEDRDGRFGGQ
jgi:hypothetical protein